MNTNLTEARPRGYPLEVHIDTELPSLSSPVSIVTVCVSMWEWITLLWGLRSAHLARLRSLGVWAQLRVSVKDCATLHILCTRVTQPALPQTKHVSQNGSKFTFNFTLEQVIKFKFECRELLTLSYF